MQVKVEEDPRFRSSLSAREIEYHNIRAALYRIPSTHRHIALVDRLNRPVEGAREIIIEEKKDLPLYKQHMQLQMGRKPRPQITYRRMFVHQIDKEEAGNYRFIIYRVL